VVLLVHPFGKMHKVRCAFLRKQRFSEESVLLNYIQKVNAGKTFDLGELEPAFTPGCMVNQIILFQSTNRTTLK
jgi:hypothetical protein